MRNLSLFALTVLLALAGAARAETEPTDAELEAAELAESPADEAPAEIDAARVECPTGAHNLDGRCVDDAPSGAAVPFSPRLPPPGMLVVVALGAAAALAWRGRRRLAFLPLAAVACGGDVSEGWDETLEMQADRALLVVQQAQPEAAGSARFRLAWQPYDVNQFMVPVNAFAIAKDPFPGAVGLRRSENGGGDRLSASTRPEDGELLGWIATTPVPGTAALTVLAHADGRVAYEAEPEALAALVEDGFVEQDVVGYVWPPAANEPEIAASEDTLPASSTPVPCKFKTTPPTFLLYAGLGADTLPLLKGCPGEVIVGEKHAAPRGPMHTVAAHAAGGRTAYVMSQWGREIRDMLRNKGAQQTADFIKAKLAAGYDYVVIDEITADPEWADTATVGKRFRQMLLKVPARKVIAYISLDLTMRPGGDVKMKGRKWLLRSLRLRAKALALEVYIHTADGVNHRAPSIFRTAQQRVLSAVHGLPGVGGISRRTITTLGLSVNGQYPQYRYLDWPAKDMSSIHAQVNALRRGGRELTAQRGLGFYFSSRSEVEPKPGSPWTIPTLATRMNTEMRRFPK